MLMTLACFGCGFSPPSGYTARYGTFAFRGNDQKLFSSFESGDLSGDGSLADLYASVGGEMTKLRQQYLRSKA
jgi:hypothetical protein